MCEHVLCLVDILKCRVLQLRYMVEFINLRINALLIESPEMFKDFTVIILELLEA